MDRVKINVCSNPWSESVGAWCLFTAKGTAPGSWHDAKWFPKSFCTLDKKEGVVEVPKWFYNRLFK